MPRIIAVLWIASCYAVASIAHAEPDEAALGKGSNYPIGTRATMYLDRFKVGSFSNAEKIYPTRQVAAGNSVMSLERGTAEITYRFQQTRYTLADYLDRRRIASLLVLDGNKIVAEYYRYGRNEQHRFISFSMAKSVVSLLVGIALDKKLIQSLDDPAEKYVVELKGSLYGQTTIRQLLRMSSGVKFTERYDGQDDMFRLRSAQLGTVAQKPLEALAALGDRSSPAGAKFTYASAETTVLGYVLLRATDTDLAELTSRWLWQPLGAEAEAAWNVGVDGQEMAEGNFNARLRDYGRLGILLANEGRIGERQIVPAEYLLDATDAARQPEAFRPGAAMPYFGYGYQFWLYPFRTRTFAMLGIYGQSVMVQPRSQIVMVQTAVYDQPLAVEPNLERDAVWRGVLACLGGQVDDL